MFSNLRKRTWFRHGCVQLINDRSQYDMTDFDFIIWRSAETVLLTDFLGLPTDSNYKCIWLTAGWEWPEDWLLWANSEDVHGRAGCMSEGTYLKRDMSEWVWRFGGKEEPTEEPGKFNTDFGSIDMVPLHSAPLWMMFSTFLWSGSVCQLYTPQAREPVTLLLSHIDSSASILSLLADKWMNRVLHHV